MVEEVFVVCSCSSLFFPQFRSATKPLVRDEELVLLRCALKTEG
jgi:diphthamide synthase subunit DPH2